MSVYVDNLMQAAAFAETFAKEARRQAQGSPSKILKAHKQLQASIQLIPAAEHPNGPRCTCGHDDFMHAGIKGNGPCAGFRCDCSEFRLSKG